MYKKFLILISILYFPFSVLAIQTINVTRGHADPIVIAINDFAFEGAAPNKIGRDMIGVIQNNLYNSGLFRPLPKSAFIENKHGVDHSPLFASWRQIGSQILLNGKVKLLGEGKFEISFILWDVVSEQKIATQVFQISEHLWRRLAHKISDQVYERVTGDKGYFDTRIVYVAQSGSPKKYTKRLAIMDQDGANRKYITDGRNLVLTPRFSSKADKILYLSYTNNKPRLYMRNLQTNEEHLLGHFHGMSFAPRFSPDGKKVIFSIAKNGATNIYEMDLSTKKMVALTHGVAINTSPTYSPDGQQIVFNSDRGGSRQIYTMNVDGSNVKRISFGAGMYMSPNWSPRGDYIAFTKIGGDFGFSIGVIRPDGSGERIITNGYLVEGPTWAPNGRVIMFTREERPAKGRGSKSHIYSIDLTGYNEHMLHTASDASDPEWSKILP